MTPSAEAPPTLLTQSRGQSTEYKHEEYSVNNATVNHADAHARKYSQAVAETTRGHLQSAEKDVRWLRAALGTSNGRARRLWYGQTDWTLPELVQVSARAGIDVVEVFGNAHQAIA